MNRPFALILSLLLTGAAGGALAEDVAPPTPAFMGTTECVSAAPTSPGSLELPIFKPLLKACINSCTVDQHRDCDAYCVQRNFLGGNCCPCGGGKCLCSGQDPADVC